MPYVRMLLRGDLPHWILGLHEQYQSNVVRIAPTELSFIGASAWSDALGRKPGRLSYEKNLKVYGMPPNVPPNLLIAPSMEHARLRRIFEPAFAGSALKALYPIIEAHVDRLIEFLSMDIQEDPSKLRDLVKWYNWTAFDVSGELTFGQSFNCLRHRSYHPWVDSVCSAITKLSFLGVLERYPILKPVLPYLLSKRMKADILKQRQSFADALQKRLRSAGCKRDFMSAAIDADVAENVLSPDEIQSNAQLLIVAASEAIATHLYGATYFLLRHPLALAQLRHEIRGKFARSEDITIQSSSDMPYLQAVQNETHRLYPTAQSGQAAIVPDSGDRISGYWIPGKVGPSSDCASSSRPKRLFIAWNSLLKYVILRPAS